MPEPGREVVDETWIGQFSQRADRVLMFRPLTDSPEEALAAAWRMVEAHQLEWVQLEKLERDNRLRRWWILADVRNPAQAASES